MSSRATRRLIHAVKREFYSDLFAKFMLNFKMLKDTELWPSNSPDLNPVDYKTYYAPAPSVGALSDDEHVTSWSDVCLSVCLSPTSGLSREQRCLRLKLAQR